MTSPRDTSRGGCAFCRHIDERFRCAHPGYPLPTLFMDARDDLERCGPTGRWWEPRPVGPAPDGQRS